MRPDPADALTVLQSAASGRADPRLGDVLAALRGHWLAIARKRYPGLAADFDDAVQDAYAKLLSRTALDQVRDAARLEAWARRVFLNALFDLARDRRRSLDRAAACAEAVSTFDQPMPASAPSAEEVACHRERLRIVASYISRLPIAKLKFADGLADRDIALRTKLTRDGVAGRLKRLRTELREGLGESGSDGPPRLPARVERKRT